MTTAIAVLKCFVLPSSSKWGFLGLDSRIRGYALHTSQWKHLQVTIALCFRSFRIVNFILWKNQFPACSLLPSILVISWCLNSSLCLCLSLALSPSFPLSVVFFFFFITFERKQNRKPTSSFSVQSLGTGSQRCRCRGSSTDSLMSRGDRAWRRSEDLFSCRDGERTWSSLLEATWKIELCAKFTSSSY